jgi:hypothetical protein
MNNKALEAHLIDILGLKNKKIIKLTIECEANKQPIITTVEYADDFFIETKDIVYKLIE